MSNKICTMKIAHTGVNRNMRKFDPADIKQLPINCINIPIPVPDEFKSCLEAINNDQIRKINKEDKVYHGSIC